MTLFNTKQSSNFIIVLAIAGIVSVGVFGFFQNAHAFILESLGDATARGVVVALGGFAGAIALVLGGLIINLFYFLLVVANYNQFLSSTAVTVGWVAVRDLVNMFFVLVLIIIAIGTILQQQQYHYSQTLPKFLAAAILVNFSKTICGIFIDGAQVVMMTFMGAISAAGGGNLAALLGLPKLYGLVVSSSPTDPGSKALVGLVLALMFLSLALIVVGMMVFIFTIRIVALWFLIILSPAVFFLMALPQDRGYASKWWDQFINYLLVGPVMAFFLWLSLTVVAKAADGITDARQIQIGTELGLNFDRGLNWHTELADLGGLGISTIGGLSGYILGIVMLIASLAAAQQLSSVGGNIAGAGLNYFKDYWTGKRGPFNPIRTGRETIATMWGRHEKRRKEGIERRADVWEGRAGKVAQVGRELGKRGARWAMETPLGEQARRAYQNVEQRADALLGGVTNGHLGVGRPYANRLAVREDEQRRRGDTAQQNATDRIQAANAEMEEIRRLEERRVAAVQRAVLLETANGGAPTVQSRAERTAAAADQTVINARHLTRNRLRAEADEFMGEYQDAQAQRQLIKVEKGFMNVVGRTLLTAAHGAAGYGLIGPLGLGTWGAAAAFGPGMVNELGVWGSEASRSAKSSEVSAVEGHAKEISSLEQEDILERMTHGEEELRYTRGERVANRLEFLRKGGYRIDQVQGLRDEIERMGVGDGVKELFEKEIAKMFPTEAFRPATTPDEQRQREFEYARKLDPKALTAEHVPDITPQFLETLIRSGELSKFLKEDVPGDIRAAVITGIGGLVPDLQRDALRHIDTKTMQQDAAMYNGIFTPGMVSQMVESGTLSKFLQEDVPAGIRATIAANIGGLNANLQRDAARQLDPKTLPRDAAVLGGIFTPQFVQHAIGAGVYGKFSQADVPQEIRDHAAAGFAALPAAFPVPTAAGSTVGRDLQADGVRQLDPAALDVAAIDNDDFVVNASRARVIKNVFKDTVSNAKQDAARAAMQRVLEAMQGRAAGTAGAHLDAAGALTPEYERLLGDFAEVGGDVHGLLRVNNNGTANMPGLPGGFDAAVHQPVLNAMTQSARMSSALLAFDSAAVMRAPGPGPAGGGVFNLAGIQAGALSALTKKVENHVRKGRAKDNAIDIANTIRTIIPAPAPGAAPSLERQIAESFLTQT